MTESHLGNEAVRTGHDSWPVTLSVDVNNTHRIETIVRQGCSGAAVEQDREGHSRVIPKRDGDRDTGSSPQITKHPTLPTSVKDHQCLLIATLSHLPSSLLLVENYQGGQSLIRVPILMAFSLELPLLP